MKKLIILCLVFFPFVLFGQEEENETKVKKKDKIIWLPVLASNPANGFMYGVAPALNWKIGDSEKTSYSSLLGSLIWTTKSQFLFTLKGNVYFPENKSFIMQDVRYFKTSQPTFGLGTGPNSSQLADDGFQYVDENYTKGIEVGQMMSFNFLRIHESYFRRLGQKGFYGGIGYHLDIHSKIDDKLLDLEAETPVVTSHYEYSTKYGFNPEKYTLSGLSANLMYDTRDNTVNPEEGRYGFVSLKFNPEWLGSDQASSSLWTEYRDYITLNKERRRNLLALWVYGNFELGGNLPYLDLPSLGWDQYGRSGRAYPQGRFRGQSLVYTEAEWRFPLQKDKERWGGVLFFNINSATNRDLGIDMFDYINTGVGAGLRFMISEKSRTNVCVDYAIGNYGAHGFYLGINEAF
ncbi:BamA/TamA family outer membrane protein [Tenacibaculum tangerinum]|uniref:BamA/TamA family outer membrane protein n=1 Tax=Tenacibaculum tangerinum TaxID=3038772 RepID=A0ABY8L435_9FLAO|nr:BamA/TamA family outer membrane protein [Tenacibaculum tangerinum]WGH75123.1 BamA/TamA family outer membrane protein [Tenacibaculum tangerinum]